MSSTWSTANVAEFNRADIESPVNVEIDSEDLAHLAASSANFVGNWNRLVSQTNWDKGQIIFQWREALLAEGCAASACSDETWSRLVGGVSPQHVGRLRRTFERFGAIWTTYRGLYWSHFYAALDWDDAELWLEGAVQNDWSVSQMRLRRWDSMGGIADKPREADIVSVEMDEEAQSLSIGVRDADAAGRPRNEVAAGPLPEGPDFGDDLPFDSAHADESRRNFDPGEVAADDYQPVRLFEDFGDLPEDVDQAVESMKLAILRHKSREWQDISSERLLGVLDALKRLVQQPDSESGWHDGNQ